MSLSISRGFLCVCLLALAAGCWWKEAEKARESAKALFKGDAGVLDSVPTTEVELSKLKKGVPAFIMFEETKLSGTRSEARRLIKDGGGYVNNVRVKSFDEIIRENN